MTYFIEKRQCCLCGTIISLDMAAHVGGLALPYHAPGQPWARHQLPPPAGTHPMHFFSCENLCTSAGVFMCVKHANLKRGARRGEGWPKVRVLLDDNCLQLNKYYFIGIVYFK